MKIIKSIIYCVAFMVCFLHGYAYAKSYTVNSVPNPYNQASITYVVDPDAILAKHTTNSINKRLTLLEQKTTIETAVVALSSIGNQDTRQFANKLFNLWKIGKKDKNNGLLILFVLDQREVVFEVGYGLEANLTDAKSYRLMDQYMLPYFRQDQFSEGMQIGINGVANYLEQQFYNGTLYNRGYNKYPTLIKICIILLVIVLLTIYCLWGDRIFVTRKFHTAHYVSPWERFKSILLLISIALPVSIILLLFLSFEYAGIAIYALLFFWVILVILITFGVIKKMNKQIAEAKNKGKGLICPKCRRRSIVRLKQPQLDRLTEDELYQRKIRSVSYHFFGCSQEKCGEVYHDQEVKHGWKTCPHCQLVTLKRIETIIEKEVTKTVDGKKAIFYQCEKCSLEQKEYLLIESEKTRLSRINTKNGSSKGGFGGGSFRGGGGGFRGGGSSGGGGARGRF